MPSPAIVSSGTVGAGEPNTKAYGGAPETNAMPATVALVPGPKPIWVWDDGPNAAVFVGTPAGTQFAAVFQSPDDGCAAQVAFPPAPVAGAGVSIAGHLY
jgi:hypothetical protein